MAAPAQAPKAIVSVHSDLGPSHAAPSGPGLHFRENEPPRFRHSHLSLGDWKSVITSHPDSLEVALRTLHECQATIGHWITSKDPRLTADTRQLLAEEHVRDSLLLQGLVSHCEGRSRK